MALFFKFNIFKGFDRFALIPFWICYTPCFLIFRFYSRRIEQTGFALQN